MFKLHERLEADTAPVIDWPLCRVLLMNDATYPWLILVPRRAEITEIHQLSREDRATLVEEIAIASERLQVLTCARKMNVGALGNVVPQLHVHVIARFDNDAAWPKPVWGVVPTKPYEPATLQSQLAAIRHALV